MSDSRPSHPLAFDVLRAVLAVAGGLALAAGMVGGIVIVANAGAHASASMGIAVVTGLAVILAGILVAALLWAASAMVSLLAANLSGTAQLQTTQENVRAILGRVEQSLHNLPGAVRSDGSRPVIVETGAVGDDASWRRAGELLDQIRDIQLMDEAQRKRWAARHWAGRKEQMTERIERDVLVGQWALAFSRLQDLEALLPDDPVVKELRLSVETEQATRLEEDLRSARAQLRPLMASGLWQQAEELAASIHERYADKPEAAQLVAQVRSEHETYDRENAQRLFHEVASATERKQWRLAIQTLEEFIRRYPADKRAEALRLDLPTLQENAASHERKELEEQFKDLLKRQRYDEAIVVARTALLKYPTSPTATELNKLLPRVEELARQAQVAPIVAQQAVGAGAG